MKTTIAIALILSAGVSHASAQTPAAEPPQAPAAAAAPLADTRFNTWLGCWRLEDDLAGTGARMCITPSAKGVWLQTVVGTQRGVGETILADGVVRSIADADCQGTEQAEWSRDGLRLFRDLQVTCKNETPRTIKSIAFLTPQAEWTLVQHVSSPAGSANVRVQRYRRAFNQNLADGSPAPQPGGAAGAMATARDAEWSIDDVIEAAAKLPEEALQAALADTRHGFNMSRANLLKLDDAKVPGSVIDLMVALTFPRRFQVERPGSGAPVGVSTGMGWYDPFMASWMDYTYGDCYFGNRYYGYRSYYNLCGYYPSYGYGNYYNGYYGGGYYPPGGWIIVDGGGGGNGGAVETGTGRAVNGRGYTQIRERAEVSQSRGTSRGDGSASGYSGGGGSATSGGYSSGSSGSSGSSSGGGGGASSGGDRTAVARPPGGGN